MAQLPTDLNEFGDFERNTHHELAQTYHSSFSIVSDRAIEPLLDAAHVKTGTRLLDVATGPGTLAARAAERGASVIGVDVAPAMVALARKLHPALDFREKHCGASLVHGLLIRLSDQRIWYWSFLHARARSH
jgi:ubiquinone/menaquinone biosynthesis C-methylase UbiE